MRRMIGVFVGDAAQPVGSLRYEIQAPRELATFEYLPAWLERSERYAIDPRLVLQLGPQFHRKVRDGSAFPGAIADTEPDGWGRQVILRDHAKRRRGGQPVPAELTSLDFLLAVDDSSRVGALRFQDEGQRFQRESTSGQRSVPPLGQLGDLQRASRAVETGTETAADLAFLRGRGTSLGGLRPKCSVMDSGGRLSIGKFPSVSDTHAVTKGEVLALKLAAAGGIDAARAELVNSDGVPVALIRRFDRSVGGGRRMYISAATLLGATPGDTGEHSYTEIVDALRIYGASSQADVEELWRRIAFSILITNVDDHLRNHGFLHAQRGQWRLAPAFDVNPFPDRRRELKTWISEESGPEARIDSLLSVGPYFGLSATRARAMLAKVEKAVSSWRRVGKGLGLSKAELEGLATAFEHPERTAASKAVGTRAVAR